MSLFKWVKRIDQNDGKGEKVSSTSSSEANAILKDWYADKHEWLVVQRNVLFIILLVCAATISFLTMSVSYIKSTRSIEPFVIEIDPKTGVPTVVDPIDAKVYYANEAIKRFFVWKYIKTREEFFYSTFDRAYNEVGLMSTDEVYGQYRRAYNKGNPQSPYNLYGNYNFKSVELKSMIFQDDKTAQVRIRVEVSGTKGAVLDKIIYMQFRFDNLELNENQRYVNPLGFVVTLYKIEDEKI